MLRAYAQHPNNLEAAEKLITEYFRDVATALTKAIDADEDWSRIRLYVQTCLGRLLGEIDERRLKD